MSIPKSILNVQRHVGDDDFLVNNHLYHQLEIVHLDPLPLSFTNIVDTSTYIKLDVQLKILLNPHVLDTLHEHKRNVSMLSLHTHPHHSTQVEIQNGKLIMSLPRDTYQTFGLNGQKKNKAGSHYIVRLALDPKANAKLIDRARWCFEHTMCSLFTLALKAPQAVIDLIRSSAQSAVTTQCKLISKTWHSSAPAPIPSISNLVHCLDEHPSVKRAETKKGPVPCAFKKPSKLPHSSLEYLHDILEWVGMVVHKADALLIESTIDPYISMYKLPKSTNISHGSDQQRMLHMTSIHGLMTSDLVINVLDILRPKPDILKRSRGEIFPGGLVDSMIIVIAKPFPSQISKTPVSEYLWILVPKPMNGFVHVRVEDQDFM